MSAIILTIVRCPEVVGWVWHGALSVLIASLHDTLCACVCMCLVIFLAFPKRANYIRAVSICDSHSFLVAFISSTDVNYMMHVDVHVMAIWT